MRLFLGALIIGLIACCSSAAQDWFSYTTISQANQLALDSADRSLWGASSGGLFRFDRADTVLTRRLTNVDGLPFIEVRALAIDGARRKWIGTAGGGLAVFDPSGSVVSVFSRNDGLVSDTVYSLLCAGAYAFAGMPHGLSFYNGTRWQSIHSGQFPPGANPLGSRINALAMRHDTVWIGTDQGLAHAPIAGVVSRDPAAWTRVTGLGGTSLNVLYILLDGSITMAGTENGLSRWDGANWQSLPAFGGYSVRSLVVRKDTVFCGTHSGVKWIHQGSIGDISAGLPSASILSLAADSSELWAGTQDGIARLDGGTWHSYRFDGPASNDVTQCALAPDGTLWLGHWTEFASRFRDGQWRSIICPVPGIPLGSLTVDARGTAWYGLKWWDGADRSYIVRIDASGAMSLKSAPFVPNHVGIWAAHCDGRNFKYFSAYKYSVLELADDDSAGAVYTDPSPSGAYSDAMYIISIARDQGGALWLGSYYNDLTRLTRAGTWEHFGERSGLPNTKVNSIAVDRADVLWLATDAGLCRAAYDPALRRLSCRTFNTGNSQIAGDNIRSVAIDRADNKWIGTEAGLSLLTWDGQWRSYTQSDDFGTGSRLLSDDIRQVAVGPRDQNGDNVYIATDRGLSRFRYAAPARDQQPEALVAPNPFVSGRDPCLYFSRLPDRAVVRIYTVDGRLCGTFDGPAAPAHTLVIWPDRDFASTPASGLYLCRISAPGRKASVVKLVIVR